VPEITADPQAAENNAWIQVSDRAGHTVRMPAGPADFDGMNSPVTEASPEPGEHTEQVLLDLVTAGRTSRLEGRRRHPVSVRAGMRMP